MRPSLDMTTPGCRKRTWLSLFPLLAIFFTGSTLFAQMGDLYRQAAASYRNAAAQSSGAQAQCYLSYARYNDCLANMMSGGSSCSQPSCSIAPSGGASGSSSPGGGGQAASRIASGGNARQQAISQGFNLLRGIIASSGRDRLEQDLQQQQNAEAAQQRLDDELQNLQQMDRALAQQMEQLLQAAGDQLLAGGQNLVNSADQLLSGADSLLNDPLVTQGNKLSQANADQCPNGWGDQNFTVTPWGSDQMWLQADALASITNEDGQASFSGGYLSVQYGASHKSHLYFGLSGVLNNDLPPGGSQRIYLPIYRSKTDPPISVSIRVRYCRQ
jgi:hypothetical protein